MPSSTITSPVKVEELAAQAANEQNRISFFMTGESFRLFEENRTTFERPSQVKIKFYDFLNVFRQTSGVIPVSLLNLVARCWAEENLSMAAISPTGRFVCDSSSCACRMPRLVRMKRPQFAAERTVFLRTDLCEIPDGRRRQQNDNTTHLSPFI